MTGDTGAGADRRPTSGQRGRFTATAEELESVFESLEERADPGEAATGESAPETALVVTCSMSTDGYSGAMWPVDPSWNAIGVPTVGNQTREGYGDETVLEASLAHLASEHDVGAVLVVGHTGCEVVGDAHERCVAPAPDVPAGIESRLAPIVDIVEDAFDAGVVDESTPPRTARYRLVEYNVVRQVAFLRGRLPASTTTVGYVHDDAGAYSSFPGRRYLVTLDGETGPATVRARLPDDASARVASLLN